MIGDGTLPDPLVWADDSAPGIRRVRAGKGFAYRAPGGGPVNAADRERIKALAVPPAWTDVWISPRANDHIQATGRDARGRKQYRYHAEYRAHREQAKFSHLLAFGEVLPAIRGQVADDLSLSGVPKDKVVATVVRLLETTLVRVGNEEYARANRSYGLTTLRDRHAQFTSQGLQLVFKGKHGIATKVAVQDARLRRVVKQCQDLPGQTLFQYVDEEGLVVPVSSTDVNAYLRAVTDADVTAKDFRTWMATLLAAVTLVELPPPATARAAKQSVVRTIEFVASYLGNTPAVCRASYVHPQVIEWYEDDTLGDRWERASARGSRLLLADERKLLRLLRGRRARQLARAA